MSEPFIQPLVAIGDDGFEMCGPDGCFVPVNLEAIELPADSEA